MTKISNSNVARLLFDTQRINVRKDSAYNEVVINHADLGQILLNLFLLN